MYVLSLNWPLIVCRRLGRGCLTRDFFEFESIAPTNRLPLGGIDVAAGSKGSAGFFPTSSSTQSLRVSRPRASSGRAGARHITAHHRA